MSDFVVSLIIIISCRNDEEGSSQVASTQSKNAKLKPVFEWPQQCIDLVWYCIMYVSSLLIVLSLG